MIPTVSSIHMLAFVMGAQCFLWGTNWVHAHHAYEFQASDG